METLVLNGTTYVKASKAARDLGYTSDYVGQLCRGGRVDAHLVGRTWYVNQDQLGEHRVEKKRISRVKAREQAHKSIEEHKKLRAEKTKNIYKNIAIRYESDKAELIPEVRKLSIKSDATIGHGVRYEENLNEIDDDEPYTIENKGNKVVMSGKLKIVDVSDEQIDSDTTLLTPRIEKKHISPQTRARAFEDIAHIEAESVAEPELEEESEPELEPEIEPEALGDPEITQDTLPEAQEETVPTKSRFMTRLEEHEVVADGLDAVAVLQDNMEQTVTPVAIESVTTRPLPPQKSGGVVWVSLFTLLLLFVATGTLMLESTWTYEYDAKTQSVLFNTTYRVEPVKTLEIIHQKIKISR